MELINNTDFSVETMPFKGPDGTPVITVIVKGTFDFNEGGVDIAPEQLPVFFGDEFFDPENGGSVKFESDMVPFKPKADIALIGKAYAPGGEPTASCDIKLRVGTVEKTIRVFGDRKWDYGGKMLEEYPTQPEPFTEMPLIFENAFGGMDAGSGSYCKENPIGKGFCDKKTKESVADKLLPNFEDPDSLMKSCTDKPRPAGFSFYAKSWEPRLSFLGTYDEKWRKERSPDSPEDFNFMFHNAAHPDLQSEEYLSGNEDVELINLTPDGQVKFSLPPIKVTCRIDKIFDHEDESLPQETIGIEMNLDTLCIISDENRFYLIWRGVCPVWELDAMEVRRVNLDVVDHPAHFQEAGHA